MNLIRNNLQRISLFVSSNKHLFIGLLVIFSVALLIHIIYKIPAASYFFIPSWSAGELLSYSGSIIASFATIIAVRMTIRDNRKQLELSQRNACRPNLSPIIWHDYNGRVKEFPSNSTCIYIIESSKDGIFYLDELDSSLSYQMFRKSRTVTHETTTAIGKLIIHATESHFSTALSITNVGAGPAINIGISLRQFSTRLNSAKEERYASIPPLAVGDNFFLGIVFQTGMIIDEEYELICRYSDVQDNQYLQRHKILLNKGFFTLVIGPRGELFSDE